MLFTSRFILPALVATAFASQAPAQLTFSSSTAPTVLQTERPVPIPFWRVNRPDNLHAEAIRLKRLHATAFAQERFGGKSRRGFLVKQLDGPLLMQSNAALPFQPASTLKVVPYAIAIDYAARGIWQPLDTEALNWLGATPASGKSDNPCDVWLKQHATVSKISRSAHLKDILPTMMYMSDNALHESLLRKIGAEAFNKWLGSKGLWNTRQYYGCQYPHSQDWWRYNRSTLNDLAKLYTWAESAVMFGGRDAARKTFMDNLVLADNNTTTAHHSKIRDFSANYSNNAFRKTVQIEAALMGKDRFVEQFMQLLTWRGKGGAGGSGNKDYAESGFGILSVPHKVNGKIVMRHYVLGIFTDRVDLPAGCENNAACASDLSKSRAVQRQLMERELPIEPIRRALQTWTLLDVNAGVFRGQASTRFVQP